VRWKIEQFHRELKQLTGVEKCQARKEGYKETTLPALCWFEFGSRKFCQKSWLYGVSAQAIFAG
jgi:hypothetical protein